MSTCNIYLVLVAQLDKLARHNRQGSFHTRKRYYEAMKRFCFYLASSFHLQKVYPQGYAAVARIKSQMFGVNLVADIGNGTMNVLYIINGRPQQGNMFTEKFGTHQCTLAVREAFMRKTHRELNDAIIDSQEVRAFLTAAQGNRFETILLLTLFTGMRRGEVCSLTWDCVDLEKGTILVNKQLQNVPGHLGEYRLVSTKNGKGRTIVPAPTVIELLRKHRTQQNLDRLKAGSAWNDSGFVFCNELGERVSPHTVYDNYKKIVASIGLPEARLHDLRHSYAVVALQAGDDIKTVQGNLGHHTASFTLDVYGHVTEQMKQASAARMEAFIQSVSGR